MQNHAPPIRRPAKGFALIVTLTLMVLLVVISMGMLGLASVTLRSSAQQGALAEARANARLALVLAVGELQKHTGPDTRITAPADLVAPGAPPVVGAWKSWEGLNHETAGPTAGRPIQPDYSIKTRPASSGNGRFLNWLISSAATGEVPANPATLAFTAAAADGSTIPLLGAGTLGANPGQVHVAPQVVANSGTMAWWVSPENQKARLTQPHQPRTDDAAGWVEAGQSHTVPDPGVFGLDALANDPEGYMPDPNNPKPASRAITLASTELITGGNGATPHNLFHDLSTSATGLLTNTATGGWRKDLSVLTEKWDTIYASYPSGRLPLFRYSPDPGTGSTSQVARPTVNSYDPAQSNLYPWSEYSLILGVNSTKQPNTYHAASASWQSLVSFATSYKNFSYNAGVVESPFVWDAISRHNSLGAPTIYNYKHTQRLYPHIARFQFLVYARAVESPEGQNPKRYQLRLKYVPVVTLWNPYNLGLSFDIPDERTFALGFGWRRSLPGVMAVVNQATFPNPDMVPRNQFRMLNSGNFQYLDVGGNHGETGYENALPGNVAKGFASHVTRGVQRVQILGNLDIRTYMANLPSGPLTFKPGEAKVFSPDGRIERRFGGTGIGLKEGYNPTNVEGFEFALLNNLTAEQAFWFLMRTDRLTQPYKHRNPGQGFTVSFGRATGNPYTGGELHSAIHEELHNLTSLVSDDEGNVYWPPDEVDEVGYSIGELVSGPALPLFSMSFGPRMTIGTGPGTQQNRPTKGMVQSNPLASMVLIDPVSGDAKAHPANGTFDITYHSMSIGSTITPNLSDSEGFIATGYQSGDGLSRLIMNEIPLRPMASLVELQGWNPRGNNPYPPFQMNLIGNSDATPLIPGDNIVPPTLEPSDARFNLQHDDAYCANHLLFDDWFVSSIAPQPRVLGGDINKDIETFYRDVLTGDDRLSNRSYWPIAEDANLTPAVAAARVDEILNSADGWLKIASRLEVDGMFNVNSTSVNAWKAILGQARNREKIAMHGADGIESTTASTGHAVTRGAVATDVEAGTGPGFGGQFPNASEFTGFRSLSDDQIEDLAEKIVEQVRLRGPFLSLAEFVNRQLGTDDNLAMAGAVQTAINRLDDDPMAELRDPANSLSAQTMPSSDPKLDGVDYAYAAAAAGDSAHGAPGWIRQADVLRPIAPILSARDDTFTIRAYADVRSEDGTTVIARAWCEAVVVRSRNFCDETDAADSAEPPASPANAAFGRKYEIVSFRWLNESEV